MPLTCGSCSVLGSFIGTGLMVHGCVVVPSAELVLILDGSCFCHWVLGEDWTLTDLLTRGGLMID